jgi:hypothetical protein
MGINNFFTVLFTINRPSWGTDGSGNPESTLEEVGTFNGHLQQAQPELAVNLGLALTKVYTIWCPPDTAVRAGDSLESVHGRFSVKAIQDNGFVGVNKHLELVVELDEANGS